MMGPEATKESLRGERGYECSAGVVAGSGPGLGRTACKRERPRASGNILGHWATSLESIRLGPSGRNQDPLGLCISIQLQPVGGAHCGSAYPPMDIGQWI